MRFGAAVPIFASPGELQFRTPDWDRLNWTEAVEFAQYAELVGLDSLWVADHLFLGRDGEILEGWTVLSALAAVTRRIRLGTIHLANGFRHPPLLAKMSATLDVISDGRLDLFLDSGWREREFVAYGYPWVARSDRLADLDEAIVAMRALWSGHVSHYVGRGYELVDAICTPRPRQEGGPPIWLGDDADLDGLDLVARRGDVWNSTPAPLDLLADKLARLDRACIRIGRDPASLRRTVETQVLVCEDEADLLEQLDRMSARRPKNETIAMTDIEARIRMGDPAWSPSPDAATLRKEFLVGTPAEVVAKLGAYQELGISEVICWFMDFPARASLDRFTRDVMTKV